jgi:DNA processing protein
MGPTNMNAPHDEHIARLALASIEGMGAARFEGLLWEFGAAQQAIAANITALRTVVGVSLTMAERIIGQRDALDTVRARWDALHARGVTARFRDEPAYPDALRKIPDAPPLLLSWGLDGLIPERSLAIVGTRRPCPEALEAADHVARVARADGWCVVSGLARGTDAAAHRAAIDGTAAGEWASIAVLGHDLTAIYPPEHRQLAVDVGRVGAVVSERLIADVRGRHLVKRNRIISGLCRGIMLIQSGREDGALHTARFADAQRRDVAVWDPAALSVESAGAAELVSRGRRFYDAASISDWLAHLDSQTEFPNPMLLFDRSDQRAGAYWREAREAVELGGGCDADAAVPDYAALHGLGRGPGACGCPWEADFEGK